MKIQLIAFGLIANLSQAAVVSLSPTDIHGGVTTTSSFTNGDVTLTPLVGGAAATFNSNAARLGTDPAGTSNANGFADPDQTAGNANDETLMIGFGPTVGLTGLSWDFARADGPLATDGIRISGFLSDPGATLTGPGTSPATYSAGVLTFELSSAAFVNTDGFLTLSDPAASAGQTLNLSVNDSTQAGALFPITSFSYENAVPEPSSAILSGLAGLLLLRRRR